MRVPASSDTAIISITSPRSLRLVCRQESWSVKHHRAGSGRRNNATVCALLRPAEFQKAKLDGASLQPRKVEWVGEKMVPAPLCCQRCCGTLEPLCRTDPRVVECTALPEMLQLPQLL